MKKVLILTDSCSDLCYERLGDCVMVVPYIYHHESEGLDLRDMPYTLDELNTSDIVSYGVKYNDVYQKLVYAYEHDLDVLALYSSGEINKTNEATFLLAIEDFKKSYNDKKINIIPIDSGLFSSSLGILINTLIELEQKGSGIYTMVKYIKDNIDTLAFDFISDSRGKGIEDNSLLCRLLHKDTTRRQIFSVHNGKIVSSRKGIDPKTRLDILVERFMENADLTYPVSIVHNNNEKDAVELYRDLVSLTYDIEIADCSRVVSSVMGENAVGISYKKKVR